MRFYFLVVPGFPSLGSSNDRFQGVLCMDVIASTICPALRNLTAASSIVSFIPDARVFKVCLNSVLTLDLCSPTAARALALIVDWESCKGRPDLAHVLCVVCESALYDNDYHIIRHSKSMNIHHFVTTIV